MSADNRYTYAKAGVSIDAGNALVKAIGPLVKATRRPGADAEIGGFGGFFDPKAAGRRGERKRQSRHQGKPRAFCRKASGNPSAKR
jgi:hypothetical protein